VPAVRHDDGGAAARISDKTSCNGRQNQEFISSPRRICSVTIARTESPHCDVPQWQASLFTGCRLMMPIDH
jgi:hypothetical protein